LLTAVPAAETLAEEFKLMPSRNARAPYTMISIIVSQGCEMTRWLLERAGLPFVEQLHAPLLHVIATLMARGGVEAPVIVTPHGPWSSPFGLLEGIDAHSPPGRNVFGDTEAERLANQALFQNLQPYFGPPMRQYVYNLVLPNRTLMYPLFVYGAPAWERFIVRNFYSIWRWLLAKALGLTPANIQAAPGLIEQGLAMMDAEIAKRGTPFLCGEAAGGMDVVIAASMSPVIFPPEFGGKLPDLALCPTELRDFIARARDRPSGRLALAVYATARNPPAIKAATAPGIATPAAARPDIATPPGKPSGAAGLLCLRALPLIAARVGIALAHLWGKPFRFGKLLVAARYRDVSEVLSRDLDFIIKPVNAARFDEIGYHFILGMDRSAELIGERHALYEALAAVDMAPLERAAAAEIDARLAAKPGSIDIVEDYARPIAATTARALFGIAPADNALFMDAARSVFDHCFLNLTGDKAVLARAMTASALMSDWFNEEIARRRASGTLGEDMMGQMLRRGFADDLIRRTLGGMLVGSIDTTATVVAKVISVMMDDPLMRALATRDRGDPERLYGWCQDALRRWPQTPVLGRAVAADTTLAGVVAPAGARVILWTQAAMYDASAFPDPDRMRRDRPWVDYLHLGGGLHPCAGRGVNAWQIPMLVAGLLERRPTHLGPLEWAGPFPAHLPLQMRGAST
jgi:cytochrome P450